MVESYRRQRGWPTRCRLVAEVLTQPRHAIHVRAKSLSFMLSRDSGRSASFAEYRCHGKLPQCDVEQELSFSERTAKRVLGELSEFSVIGFDRPESLGFRRVR